MGESEKMARAEFRRETRARMLLLMPFLFRESDRGCALVAGALLDERLAALLMAVFREPATASTLLEINGPLGSFATRTKLAHCLGLVSPDEFHDLGLVCKIRNEAAHFEKKRGDGLDTGFGNKATQSRVPECVRHAKNDLHRRSGRVYRPP
jgi:hypothetical protein